jgi:hypothetical protein
VQDYELPLRKRNVIFSVLLSFAWLILLASMKIAPATFRPELKDHISNIHSSILFWHRGIDVYKKSMQASSDGVVKPSQGYLEQFNWRSDEVIQLKEREGKEPLLIVWLNIPRPYPPGLWVVLAPFAALTEALGKLTPLTVYVLEFFVLLCAHFCFFIIWNSVCSHVGKIGSAVLAVVLYNEIVGWSLCSQIDAIALLIFVWSLFAFKNRDFWSFFSRFSLVSLIQFRLLFFLPLFLVKLNRASLEELIQSLKERNLTDKFIVLLSGAGLVLSAYVFLLVIDSVRFESAFNNPLHYSKWGEMWQGNHWLFLFLFALVVGWLVKSKDYLLLMLAIWWALFFSSMSFVRGWYVLFLLPVLLINEKRPWPAFALYAVFATTFFSSFPLDFWLPRMVITLLIRSS